MASEREPTRRQHLNRDDRNGWVRGIVCFNCNGGLGQCRDDAAYLA